MQAIAVSHGMDKAPNQHLGGGVLRAYFGHPCTSLGLAHDVHAVTAPSFLDQYALNLVKADLVVAPVVEAGRAGALVVRHLLRYFELSPVP